MLAEVEQALLRLEISGLSSSRAAYDLWQLHNRYTSVLERIAGCTAYPHVMRILAEEAIEGLSGRFTCLGIPMKDSPGGQAPLYWTEYTRFLKAQTLMEPFLNDSYIDEALFQYEDYKTKRYAYALSDLPLPVWFTPEGVLQSLEEIITAFGFL